MPSRRRRVRQRRSLPSLALLRRRLRRPGAASRLRAEALYRASVQAGRPVVVQKYSVYAPRTNGPAVLPVERRVLACTGWAGETVGFFEQSLGVYVHNLISKTRLKGFPLWMSLFRPFRPRMKHVIEQPAIYGQVDEDHESTNGNLEGSSQTARIDKWNQIVFNKSARVP